MVNLQDLITMTSSILTLPHNTNSNPIPPIYPQEEEHHLPRHIISAEEEEGSNIYSRLQLKGAGKIKKKSASKKKQIDTYTKDKLVKMAKKNGIKLSSKGVKRTKIQLFNSLKRKKMI